MTDAGVDAEFLAAFHDQEPGITARVLGEHPYAWLAQALPPGTVLDLCCGSAPLAGHVGPYLGLDVALAELKLARTTVVRADAARVPVADASVDAVACSMALMLVPDLQGVLREVRRVLRPGGVLAALLPASGPLHWADRWTYARAFLQLRATPSYLRTVTQLEGFEITDDTSRRFRSEDAGLVIRSLYLPGTPQARVTRVASRLRGPVGVPLRRIVARPVG
jgi:ubiquinone/menaquinone biosynthesis C-methylase UbiE